MRLASALGRRVDLLKQTCVNCHCHSCPMKQSIVVRSESFFSDQTRRLIKFSVFLLSIFRSLSVFVDKHAEVTRSTVLNDAQGFG